MADKNVVIGEKMQSFLLERGVGKERVTVIPNWADPTQIEECDTKADELRTNWGWEGKFVVAYSGNLGRVHDIDTILDAIEMLDRRRPLRDGQDILFAFIGGGARRSYLKAEIERRGLTNVDLRPYQPQEQLSALLSAADVHLVSLLPEFEGLVVPSKVYGVMAAGRPVVFVGSEDGEVGLLISSTGCGFTIGIGQSAELADAVERLADEPDLRSALGAAARRAFDEAFTRQISALKWHSLISEISIAASGAAPALGGVGVVPSDRGAAALFDETLAPRREPVASIDQGTRI